MFQLSSEKLHKVVVLMMSVDTDRSSCVLDKNVIHLHTIQFIAADLMSNVYLPVHGVVHFRVYFIFFEMNKHTCAVTTYLFTKLSTT